jgi:tRNA(fMet)-specific endonuclease VapC
MSPGLYGERSRPARAGPAPTATLAFDTNICVYVIKNRPVELREQFDRLTEQICISTITLAELYYGLEKSAWHAQNLRAVEEFAARLEALLFSVEAAAHYAQV